nr:N-acetyltransferase [Rhizobium sp. Khangiran2]
MGYKVLQSEQPGLEMGQKQHASRHNQPSSPHLPRTQEWLRKQRGRLASRLAMGLISSQSRYSLRRDLELQVAPRPAKIPITVRPLCADDLDLLMPQEASPRVAERSDPTLGGFPRLDEDTALLENAYTPPSHRGLGIMSAAMALIAERAASFGARYVLTFVGTDNVASLKGCQRAGFEVHLIQRRLRMGYGLIGVSLYRKGGVSDAPK